MELGITELALFDPQGAHQQSPGIVVGDEQAMIELAAAAGLLKAHWSWLADEIAAVSQHTFSSRKVRFLMSDVALHP